MATLCLYVKRVRVQAVVITKGFHLHKFAVAHLKARQNVRQFITVQDHPGCLPGIPGACPSNAR